MVDVRDPVGDRRPLLEMHGGYGYINEYEVARLWRDSRVQRVVRRHHGDHEGSHGPSDGLLIQDVGHMREGSAMKQKRSTTTEREVPETDSVSEFCVAVGESAFSMLIGVWLT